MKMAYMETVRSFIVDNFLFGDGAQLIEDTSFLEDGIVDSTGILELITFLEETFLITVEDDEMVPENMDSVNRIVSYLEKKLSDASRPKDK
ncbi:acyl carrier protein [Planctomycetota bacterium]